MRESRLSAGSLAHVDPSERDTPCVDVPEACEQIHERGFARPGSADKCAGRALGNGKRHAVDHATDSVVGERHVLHREVEPDGCERRVHRVLLRHRAHLVDAVELPLDLLGKEGAVVRTDELAVDHEGGDKERERPGKRKRACQVQRARGEQHSTAGEVEHERVKLQYALGGLLLIEVGLPLALEGGLRLRQRLVGRGERTQHRHPAGILDHRIRHVLLGRRHLAGDRRRTPSQPLEDDEPDRDSPRM